MGDGGGRSFHGLTQRITAADIAAGRIRIPSTGHTKELLPSRPEQISVVLKGRAVGACRYDPRLGPDRERSGVILIDAKTLAPLVGENERLPVVRSRNGVIYIGDRGSKLRIADWVNQAGDRLGKACIDASPTLRDFVRDALPKWRSPLRANDYAEISSDLWRRLRLPGPDPHEDGFWPAGQPHWDAVATLSGPSGSRGVLLVEAKSHLGEIVNSCSATSARSRRTIVRSLDDTKVYLGVERSADWTTPHYQAANRLAFLYYLRARRNIPTWLYFIYFIGDAFEVDGKPQRCPATAMEWHPALDEMHGRLGLPACHPLVHFTHDLFLPASPA